MKKSTTLKSHNLYIENKDWERATAVATQKQVSVATVIREALKYWLDCRGY